jgi:hypothetical protein
LFDGYCSSRVFGRLPDGARRGFARLLQANDNTFHRGMHYPSGWDPYFRDYMTIADIYRYPGQHFDRHRRQLTLTDM